jgi:hypothetical protein
MRRRHRLQRLKVVDQGHRGIEHRASAFIREKDPPWLYGPVYIHHVRGWLPWPMGATARAGSAKIEFRFNQLRLKASMVGAFWLAEARVEAR